MRYLSDFFGNIPGIMLHEYKFFLHFLYVFQSFCWLTSLLNGPSLGNLKDQRVMQDKPSGPMGYNFSPPATSPIISSAFALWANLELYILVNLNLRINTVLEVLKKPKVTAFPCLIWVKLVDNIFTNRVNKVIHLSYF